ncbi:MAG: hypothetical protein HZA53_08365 [Planctomycetes bacterium]|nr:hypothetical protein [Planctomycetota bacterium]
MNLRPSIRAGGAALLLVAGSAAADQLHVAAWSTLDISAANLTSIGDLAYEPDAEKLWISDGAHSGQVYRINPLTGAVLGQLSPSAIAGLSEGPDALAVLSAVSAGALIVLSSLGESEGGRVTQSGALLNNYGTSNGATGATFFAGTLWIVAGTTLGGGASLHRMNSVTGAILTTVQILGTTSRMVDVDFDPNTGACYMLEEATNNLVEIDLATGLRLSTTSLAPYLIQGNTLAGGIAFDTHGEFLYVGTGTGAAANTIIRLQRDFETSICDGTDPLFPCPCGNPGAPGAGCASSVNPNGAVMHSVGVPDIADDTLVVRALGIPVTAPVLFFQGTTPTATGPTVLGDGLICVSGSIIRLGTKIASGGVATYPGPADPALHVRGAIPAGGGTRYYQGWYRNASNFCTSATFNFTNAIQVRWTP